MKNEMSDDEYFNYLIELEDEEKIQQGKMDFEENPMYKVEYSYQIENDYNDDFDNDDENIYKKKTNNNLGCSSYIIGILILFLIYYIIVYLICGVR